MTQANVEGAGPMVAPEQAPNQNRHLGLRITASGVVLGLLIGTALEATSVIDIFSEGSSNDTTASVAGDVPAGTQAVGVTDAELLAGGFNCAPTNRPEQQAGHFNYADQIEFLNAEPQLAENLRTFNVTDSQYGMGNEAWRILLDKGFTNTDTPADAVINSNSEMNTLAHKTVRMQRTSPETFTNFTCVDSAGKVSVIHVAEGKPVIVLGQGNYVDGVMLTKNDTIKFMKSAKNLDKFDILPSGKQTILNKKGKPVEVDTFIVVLNADGCRNPIRKGKATVVTSNPPGQPPMTFVVPTTTPETTTPTVPDKVLAPTPGGLTPGVTLPAVEGAPTPDVGTHPVGDTQPATPTTQPEIPPSTVDTTIPTGTPGKPPVVAG